MKIKFRESEGSEATILFNPVVTTETGKIRIFQTTLWFRGESYSMPEVTIPAGHHLWIRRGKYSEKAHEAGDLLAVWPSGDTMNVLRYYPNTEADGVLKRISSWWGKGK
jgi:hypothetical protein